MSGLTLLVVDGAPDEELTRSLEAAGVQVTWCTRGHDALVSYGSLAPDAVLIAPTLEDLPPAEVVETIRRFGVPPILLGVGAYDAEAAGPVLVAGATGAVSRPYDASEILLRLAHELPDLRERGTLTFGPVELDQRAHTVRIGARELPSLGLKEFALLRLLMTHADQVVTTQQIRAVLWRDRDVAPSSNAVAVLVARLRTRLRPPAVVRTVRGVGYRLTLQQEQAPGVPDGPVVTAAGRPTGTASR